VQGAQGAYWVAADFGRRVDIALQHLQKNENGEMLLGCQARLWLLPDWILVAVHSVVH
jgi:hypothetical protein